MPPIDKVETITCPISLSYNYTAGAATSRFLRALHEGRLVGQRCPQCRKVYVPPRGACPRCGVPTDEEVPVRDTGTLTTFTVVHIPLPNSPVKPPFIAGTIRLDGADQTCLHLVAGCKPSDARVGLRLRAVWKPREEWTYSFENIRWFEPSGEPDVDVPRPVETD
jgi:uncharacterized OB-fold protein